MSHLTYFQIASAMHLSYPHVLMPTLLSEVVERGIASDPAMGHQPSYWPCTRGLVVSVKLQDDPISDGSADQPDTSDEAMRSMDASVRESLSGLQQWFPAGDGIAGDGSAGTGQMGASCAFRVGGASFPGCIQVGDSTHYCVHMKWHVFVASAISMQTV
jgi:hypothetical protein